MLITVKGIYENGQVILDEKPATTERVKVIVTFLDEKTERTNPVALRPSTQLRGAWKNTDPEDKREINAYFDNIRNEWERNI